MYPNNLSPAPQPQLKRTVSILKSVSPSHTESSFDIDSFPIDQISLGTPSYSAQDWGASTPNESSPSHSALRGANSGPIDCITSQPVQCSTVQGWSTSQVDANQSNSFLVSMGWDSAGSGSWDTQSSGWDPNFLPSSSSSQTYSWRSAGAMDWTSSSSASSGWKDPSVGYTDGSGSFGSNTSCLPSMRARNTSSHSSIDSQVNHFE